MISVGMSEIEIRSLITVVSSRVQRLRHFDASNVRKRKPLSHACNDETIAFLKSQYAKCELEEGFPYPRRRLTEYFIEDGITWRKVYAMYKEEYEKLTVFERRKVNLMAYSTFTQYVRCFFPTVRMSRNQQDLCDSCVRLKLVISIPISFKSIVLIPYPIRIWFSVTRKNFVHMSILMPVRCSFTPSLLCS